MRVPGLAAVGACLLVLFGPTACTTAPRTGEVTAVSAQVAPDTAVAGAAPVRLTVHDGGTDADWLVGVAPEIVDGPLRPASGPTATEGCAGEVCYRVVTGKLRVERSTDGGRTFTVDWELSGPAYDRLAAEYPSLGEPSIHLSSTSLVVRPANDGHVVFVANGRDGLLYRSTTGRWLRLGVPQGAQAPIFAEPPPLRPGTGLAWQAATAAGGLVLLVAGTTIARRRSVRPVRAAVAAAVALVVATIAYIGSGLPDLRSVPASLYATLIVIAFTAGGAVMAVAVLTGPENEGT